MFETLCFSFLFSGVVWIEPCHRIPVEQIGVVLSSCNAHPGFCRTYKHPDHTDVEFRFVKP